MTGEFTYIQDVRVPGMLHARVVRPYGVGASLLSVDESGLKQIPGFVALVMRARGRRVRRRARSAYACRSGTDWR